MADKVFNPPTEISENAYIKSMEQYKEMYDRSIQDPEAFWAEIAEEFYWKEKWDTPVMSYNFEIGKEKIFHEWFKGGKTNMCYNALDRHLETKKDDVAVYWEGNHEGEDAKYTFGELHELVCKFANVLKAYGVKKGDRVGIYMPMDVELPAAMLACARIGAVHSVVFGGFSANSLADRIMDSTCKVVITTDAVYRGPKQIGLKAITDDACTISETKGSHVVSTVIVHRRLGDKVKVTMKEGRDVWLHEELEKVDSNCPVEWVDAEDPLFMLYTSGSTGKPKGVLHTVGGYMVYTAMTFKWVFDYKPGDVFWCTADAGWITGHSYIVYGPMVQGATQVMFEGIPTFPDAGRVWAICDKFKVNQFYTAPTLIRLLMKMGEGPVKKYDRSSIRILGTVGEPINPEAWLWYYRIVGDERCPIVDTYWQTETGGFLLTPFPGATPCKPGSATFPFFGVEPVLLDTNSAVVEGAGEGALCIKKPWPGLMRSVYLNHDRFEQTYFSTFKGYYVTGDGARRDKDGYLYLTGRLDDVLNVSGHRLGTAEIESALVSHKAVAEAAVVGKEDEIKGQAVYAYVTLKEGFEYTEPLRVELRNHVRSEVGPLAMPSAIHWAPGLPKTRSGKIMRRILRKIANNELDQIGDTSTLADPSVVDTLLSFK